MELCILRLIIVIYWCIATAYFYKRGEEISKKYNLTTVIDRIFLFVLAILVGWCVFPTHLGRFLAVEILNSENENRNKKQE